ncbi:MAG TPA: sigma-70 family RNA polymerase sigma factor [Mucilaginibacter sp.]|nr:sigma-70 family RNA polymerase sigma factor [Mucilaginibacter sp.]
MPGISNMESLSAKREALFISLYQKAFPAVAKYVSRMGGSFDEAKDVFQDALIVYYEKAVAGKFTMDNDTAYLVGISKNLWLKRYREGSQNIPLDHIDLRIDEEETPSENRLMHYLEKTGQKCMELLRGFYYDELPLNDIATLFGFSGVRSATVQKYKCLEKVRETIKQKALTYDDFME